MKAFFRMSWELWKRRVHAVIIPKERGTAPRRVEKCIAEWQAHGRDCDSCNVQRLSRKKTLHLVHLCLSSRSANNNSLLAPSENISGCRSLGHTHFSAHTTLASLNYVARKLLWSPLFQVGRGLHVSQSVFLSALFFFIWDAYLKFPWKHTGKLDLFYHLNPQSLQHRSILLHISPSFLNRKK